MASLTQFSAAKRKRPADLPDFKRPPLVEVLLGVQFSELRGYRTFHAGLLWEAKFRKEFPVCRERPPLEATFETFRAPRPTQPKLEVIVAPGPTVPRLWFINLDETELIQFQADRFVHNWRRMDEKPNYPRYEPICERFFDKLGQVQTFLEEEQLGSIEPNQCEVTYVNHIALSGGVDPATHLHRILVFWTSLESEASQGTTGLPELEGGGFRLRFVITDPKSGELRGRLHVEAEPAMERDDTPVLRLNLTARGSPSSPTFQGVADFLDLGRDAIVRGFTALTTAEMHERWGRIK